jgi:hypothetical protein
MKNIAWFKTVVSVAGLAAFCVLATGSMDSGSNSSSSSGGSSSSSNYADAADQAAMQDLRSNSWVKDLYVSPGHMNIGVLRGEKDWTAPMISSYACGVLKKHGSKLNWVRFVDIQAVVDQGKSPNQAEIYKASCP